jgi:hypothetical protein
LSLRYLLLLLVVVVATERGDEVKRRGLRKRSGVGEFVAVIVIIIIVADVFVGGDRDEGELGPDLQTTEKDMVRVCEYANLKTTSGYSLGTLD